jgi:signal transduction histidine kinase
MRTCLILTGASLATALFVWNLYSKISTCFLPLASVVAGILCLMLCAFFRQHQSQMRLTLYQAVRLTRHAHTQAHHWRGAHDRWRAIVEMQQALCLHASEQSWRLCAQVRTYAHYLDEYARRHGGYENLGYDVDELQEAAEHLHFLMQGAGVCLEYETGMQQPKLESCDLSAILARFLARLAPMLERRAMRVVSDQCPASLMVESDPKLLAHSLWAMLMACLYYAAEDAILHIEATRAEGTVTVRLFASRCSPAALSPEEREAYLASRLEMPQTHMFAHALARHADTRFAERLAQLMHGRITCAPEGPYRAVLSLSVPAVWPAA